MLPTDELLCLDIIIIVGVPPATAPPHRTGIFKMRKSLWIIRKVSLRTTTQPQDIYAALADLDLKAGSL